MSESNLFITARQLLEAVEAFRKHVDGIMAHAVLRDEACVKEQFVEKNEFALSMWGPDPDTWPESHAWATFRDENMWRCELRARELNPDKSLWVRYPERESVDE